MVLAWNPIREIPAGPELLQAAEEDPKNYHTDKCKGLHLRGEGALTWVFDFGGSKTESARRVTDLSHVMHRRPH